MASEDKMRETMRQLKLSVESLTRAMNRFAAAVEDINQKEDRSHGGTSND